MITEIVLRPKLTVADLRDAQRATRILAKAEKVCLISNSVKTEIRLEQEITFAA